MFRVNIEEVRSFLLTTLTLIEGLIASSLIFLLCRIIFHAPYSSRSFLMLKRDGKWQLPVIYNRPSSSGNKVTLDWHKHPPKQFSLEIFFLSSFHYSLWLFLYFCLLLSLHFLRANNKILKSKCLQKEERRREKNVETTFLCCSIIAVKMRDEMNRGGGGLAKSEANR